MKINFNEFLIGSCISLGSAVLIGYVTTRTTTAVVQKTPPKQPTIRESPPATPVVQEPTQSLTEQIQSQDVIKEQPSIALAPLVQGDDFPLQLGSTGKRVWKLRAYLLRTHGAPGIISDEFTLKTKEQVHKFLKVETVDEQLYNTLIDPIKTIR